MTQATTWGLPTSGPVTPTVFATRGDDSLDAILSGHAGASRPSYAVAGTTWVKEVSAALKEVYIFDGASDDLIGSVDVTNHRFSPNMSNVSSINGGSIGGIKSAVINGGFTVNQRGYTSGAVLAAGVYGHDRWKAGASGGNYAFTQLESNTQIAIASGKSLIQVIENKNVHSDSYVLSWEGTATARCGVNSATPSGSYAASPITITGQSAGNVMSIEFGEGSLGKVQLEAGLVASAFESRPYGMELTLCQRYYEKFDGGLSVGPIGIGTIGYSCATSISYTEKRISPSVSIWGTWTANAMSQPVVHTANTKACVLSATITSGGGQCYVYAPAGTGLIISAEL